MDKKVVFGIAAILAVVAVAVVIAVLATGKTEDEVATEPTPEALSPREVFMQTNNSCKATLSNKTIHLTSLKYCLPQSMAGW